MGDGGILFDAHSWKTHVLNPAAAAVYETLLEHSQDAPYPVSETLHILQNELGLDPDTPEIQELLTRLKRLGIVA